MEIVQSVKFRYEPSEEIARLLEDYCSIVNFCVKQAWERGVSNLSGMHKECYQALKRKYDYNTQYFVTAFRVALSVIRTARRNKCKEVPIVKKKFMKLSPLVFKFTGDELRVSIKPRKFIHMRLIKGVYQKRFVKEWEEGKLKIGEIILNDFVIIPFKREVDITNPSKAVALDFNEANITAVTSDGKAHVFDAKEAKRLHDCYFEIRREIQRKYRGEAKQRGLAKYREREKRRVRDFLHKLSRKIADMFKGYQIIMEDLTHIRKSVRFGKKMNRRLNSWNFRLEQSFVDYKAKLNGSPVEYVSPKGTSKNCYKCGGMIKPEDKACPRCGLNRHINACLNMLKMWGSQGTPTRPSMTGGGKPNFSTP